MKIRRNQMREVTIEILVGTFFFVVLIALGIFTIALSEDALFQETYSVHMRFSDVMGLRTGDSVFMHGLKAGRIAEMELRDGGVDLVARMDSLPAIYENYRVRILPASVLGGRMLILDVGSDDQPRLPSTTVLKGMPPVDIMDDAIEILTAVRKTLIENGALSNLERTMDNLAAASDELRDGQGTLGKLLSDDTLYQELQGIVSDLRGITTRVAAGEGTIGKLLADDGQVYADLRSTMSNLSDVSDRLAAGEGVLGSLLATDSPMAKDLEGLLASLNDVASSLKEGEGTMGKLMTDDSLYVEMKKLIQDARATLDDLRETSPITTFTSVFFGVF